MKKKKPSYDVPRPPKARKFMNISPEDFFVTALAGVGPPSKEPFHFYWRQGNFMMRGVSAWCVHDPQGKLWTIMVMQTGEAKTRAGAWYSRYVRWWRDKGEQAKAAGLI